MGNDQRSSTQRPSQKQSHQRDDFRGGTATRFPAAAAATEKILDNGDIFHGRKAVAAARAAAAVAAAAGNPNVDDGGYGAAFGSTDLLPEEIPGLPRRRPAYSPRQVVETGQTQ